MVHFMDVYAQTLSYARENQRRQLDNLERCYNAISNKSSKYAIAVKGILDLQRETMKIWDDAPEAI